MNLLPKKRPIYIKHDVVKNGMVGLNHYDLPVHATLFKYEWLWFSWYRIRTFVPRLNPFYDGEYATRTACRMQASYCKLDCQITLRKLKNGHPLN